MRNKHFIMDVMTIMIFFTLGIIVETLGGEMLIMFIAVIFGWTIYIIFNHLSFIPLERKIGRCEGAIRVLEDLKQSFEKNRKRKKHGTH